MKKSFGRVLLNLFIVGLISSTGYAGDIEPLWNDPDCGTSKIKSSISPRNLMDAFLRLDSEGGFVNTSKIRDFALCPGFQGGGDSFEVIKKVNIVEEKSRNDTVEFTVKFEKLGTITSGGSSGGLNSFIRDVKIEEVKYMLRKTPYGWRIDFKSTYTPKVLVGRANSFLPHKEWVSGQQRLFKEISE